MLPTKEEVDAVLEDINKARATYNLPPMKAILKGKWRGDSPRDCPVARTVKYKSDIDFVVSYNSILNGADYFPLSNISKKFVRTWGSPSNPNSKEMWDD